MPIAPSPQLKAGLFARGGGAPKGPKTTPTGAPAPKPPPGVRIEHRIGIQAPAEVIWEAISDLDSWAQWNPLYPKAAGQIRIGGTLELTLALPGQPPQEIRPTVLEWVPNEQLHWRLIMLGGLVKTTRFLEIESLAEASCIVSNGELFAGLMGPSIAKRLGRSVYRAFVEMDEALKARAEALWAARQD
ncbi:SRPBCC family protein [Phenylobacterium sp.]|uniref:SRPBCC family protein n=1 Tax=Phenylobacterium sp. TaxID=1871053 RepID=UPI003563BCF0